MTGGGIARVSPAFHNCLYLSGVSIENSNVGIVESLRVDSANRDQDPLTSGQGARIPVLTITLRKVHFDNLFRIPAGRRNAHERPGTLGNEINHVISRPRCPYIAFSADSYRRPAVHCQFPEHRLSRGGPYESNPSAVR